MPFKKIDETNERFANYLDRVLRALEKNVMDYLGGKGGTRFNARTLSETYPEMLRALRDSGFHDLAQWHVDQYPDIAKQAKERISAKAGKTVKFNRVSIERLKDIAAADFRYLVDDIGRPAVSALHYELFQQAVMDTPFSQVVETVRAAITGVDSKNSPLKNRAYTYANTALLRLNGQSIVFAGESIGAKYWEVSGPLDDLTRDECREALSEPVRTKEQWLSAGYWGGAPGGWNCRHFIDPVFRGGK